MVISLMKVFKVPDEELPGLLELARSRLDLNRAGTRPTRSPSYAARRAALARRGGEGGQEAGVSLQAPRTPLVGREEEVLTLRSLLRKADVRLVTLLGPPGIGKTRIGLQVAQSTSGHFPDGVAFVFLSSVTDHETVMSEVVKALGLSRTPGLSSLEILKAGLSRKQMLLVLDNFEQVIEAAPDVEELMVACPGLKLVVTSRTALDIRGERLFAVPALAMPAAGAELTPTAASEYAAIALFVERARAANSRFRLTEENVSGVIEICRRLDGLPLAIELAAARTRALTPREILSRLGRGSKVLAGGAADLPSRQRSLAGAIDWSYKLLDDDEARLFRLMSVFTASPTLAAIESVCLREADEDGEPRGALELTGSLVSKSLVHKLESGDGGARYCMLQTIREYASERLAKSGEEYRAREKQALYYAGLVDSAEPYLKVGKREAWIARLDADYSDILEALAWCKAHPEQIETGLHIAWALKWYWRYRGYFSEGRGLLDDLLAVAEQAGIPRESYHRVKALSALGEFSLLYFDYEAMSSQLSEAVELWRALDDSVELAHAMTCLGAGLAHGNSASKGRALVEEAVGLLREANDPMELAYSLSRLASVQELAHEWDEARKDYEEALDIYRELGDNWRGASNLSALGYLALREGDYDRARRHHEEALDVYRAANDRWQMASAYRGLGDVELSAGRWHPAGSLYEESVRLYTVQDDRVRAAILYRRLGYVELQKGRHAAACAYFTRSVDGLRATSHRLSNILCLAAFAALAVAQGHLACAALLSPLVEDSRHELATAMSAVDLAIYDGKLANARQEMGEPAFEAARVEGRRMSFDEAVEYAKTVCGGG
jgi:predicted ATPase